MTECICRFTAAGQPMDDSGCEVHSNSKYACERTGCDDYRPIGPAIRTADNRLLWRKCICGAIAQDHN